MRRGLLRAAAATLAALVLALVPGVGPSGAVGGEGDGPSGGERAGRVLIVTLPNVTWGDLEGVDLPHLTRFFEEATIGNLATRASSRRRTRLGDGYIAIGAGTRAIGDGGTVDGHAFQVDETYGRDPARQVFARRTGVTVDEGIVHLGIAKVTDLNADLLFGAEVAALGDTLHDAGYSRAVIANADGSETKGQPPVFRRQAVGALMTSDGILPGGRVDRGLLVEDRGAPYGVRYDNEAVVDAFREAWEPRSVVLVEASDIVRADTYRGLALPGQRDLLVADALHRTDALFGELLADVDPERDAVIVVGPTPPQRALGLTVAAVQAPGFEPALLRTGTTRRSGYVQIIDIAPTVLDLLGLERPSSMQGRPFETGRRGGDASERREELVDANEAAVFIGGVVATVALSAILFHIGLLGLVLARVRGWLRWSGWPRALRLGGLALLAYLPAVYLARLVPFHEVGRIPYLLALLGASILFALLYDRIGRRDPLDAVIMALSVIVVLMVVDAVRGFPLQVSSGLGNSPIVAGRFTGFGNIAYSVFSAAGLVLAVAVAYRVGGVWGPRLGVGVLALVLVIDGTPFWGSDVGGVLSMAPAFVVTAVLLLGWRLRLRTALVALAGTVVAITAASLADLARPPNQRTHLGRLLETVGDEGWSGLSLTIERKLDANLANITVGWIIVLITLAVFIGYFAYQAPDRLRDLQARLPELRVLGIGAVLLLVLGFALNDSGVKVPGVMLVVIDAALVVLVMSREPAAPPSSAAMPRG